jgi:diguanylate cyclase (GGDEF)-like protein
MNARLTRFLPFVLGALMMLTLTSVLVRYRYEVAMDREITRSHHLLDELSSALSAELNRGAQALNVAVLLAADPAKLRTVPNPAGWHAWRSFPSGVTAADAAPLLIPPETLQRELAHRARDKSMILLGPFAADSGNNAVTIAIPVRTADDQEGWMGESILLNDLLPEALTAQFTKAGLRLQMRDTATGTALYQTDDGAVESPDSTTVRLAKINLQLRAAPRGGWHLPLRAWASMLFLLLAVLAWLSYELRRGRRLRDAAEALEAAETRRRNVNELYGKAIENVAALESRLQVVSMHDTVTGLANRSSLLRRIEVELEGMRQSSAGTLGILAIGFDQLQHITTSFGTEFASRVLVVAAERVEFVLPSKDLLYRVGDFHLAVVLKSADPGATVKLAEAIIREIEAPISMDSHTFMLHPSIGIAETSSGYEYVEALLDHANTALAAVPREAMTRHCVFDSATAKESVSRLQLEVDLNRAFDEHQFVLEYEPIVMPVSNAVAGFEALIRWNHPTEGRIPPGKFVDIAVQAGMSHRLNNWVMREAARQASVWYRAGYRDLFVNFNLSAEAFLKTNLEAEIGEVLAEYELPGHCLCVELTESTLIQDLRAAARTLQRLNELGIRAWLDDFGTGYSSLSYLRQLPLKGVKIDRSFVERTTHDSRDFGFVKSLIDLISYLGMQSIAEGIETQGQYELLSMTTCDLYQGFHFARSMSPEAAERWMNESGGIVKRAKSA